MKVLSRFFCFLALFVLITSRPHNLPKVYSKEMLIQFFTKTLGEWNPDGSLELKQASFTVLSRKNESKLIIPNDKTICLSQDSWKEERNDLLEVIAQSEYLSTHRYLQELLITCKLIVEAQKDLIIYNPFWETILAYYGTLEVPDFLESWTDREIIYLKHILGGGQDEERINKITREKPIQTLIQEFKIALFKRSDSESEFIKILKQKYEY